MQGGFAYPAGNSGLLQSQAVSDSLQKFLDCLGLIERASLSAFPPRARNGVANFSAGM
jgi:hypothetical protein